ncbi:hypothetical protein BVX98_04885, partial [bacterium F11]
NPQGGVQIKGPSTAEVWVDDDDNRYLKFSTGTYDTTEDAGLVSITIERTGNPQGQIQLDYETRSGSAHDFSDFIPQSGTLIWTDGDTSSQTFTISLLNDENPEPTELFYIDLKDLFGGVQIEGASTAEVMVVDDDNRYLEFSTGTYYTTEDAGLVSITVERTGNPQGQIQVDYETRSGSAHDFSDFIPQSGTLIWTDGDISSQTFTISLLNDENQEPNEWFRIDLKNPFGGVQIKAPSTAFVWIQDDDNRFVRFSTPSYHTNESSGIVSITVERSGNPQGQIQVDYVTRSASAHEFSDFIPQSGTLIWPDGDTSTQTFPISLLNDNIIESTEWFYIDLENLFGGAQLIYPSTAEVLVFDDDTNIPPVANAGPDQSLTDIIGDGTIDGLDYAVLNLAMGSRPGDLNWNPRVDFVADNRINNRDLRYMRQQDRRENKGRTWDHRVDVNGEGEENVVLDGSASFDEDGTITHYQWQNQAGGDPIVGSTISLNLPIGVHTFTLTVTDNNGATATDEVMITLEASPLALKKSEFDSLMKKEKSSNQKLKIDSNSYYGLDDIFDQNFERAGSLDVNAGQDKNASFKYLTDKHTVARTKLVGRVNDHRLSKKGSTICWFYHGCREGECGEESFSRPRSFRTITSFSEPGVYVVGLLVTEGVEFGFDRVEITVQNRGKSDFSGIKLKSLSSGAVSHSHTLGRDLRKLFYPNLGQKGDIDFHLSEESDITVQIKDIRGKVIRVLYPGHFTAGSHVVQWDGNEQSESGPLAKPGSYLVQVFTSQGIQKTKLVISTKK